MGSLLLAVIYLAFISLGLPDSLLGSGWPAMQASLNVPSSYAGYISMAISLMTVISSLCSPHLIKKLAVKWIVIISIALTVCGLLGFSSVNQYWQLLVWAIPYGLGAGSIDAALNYYVASHYSSRVMNFLHCFYGLGAVISPNIMAFALLKANWHTGYLWTAMLQSFILFVCIISLPLWKVNKEADEDSEASESVGIMSSLKVPGVILTLIAFFSYCSGEATSFLWTSSYFAGTKSNINSELIASFGSLIFGGLMLGRIIAGLISHRLSDRKLIRVGLITEAIGILLVIIPTPQYYLAAIGFLIIGTGMGPIYPAIQHMAPANFGKKYAAAVIGLQMAAAYVGSTFMPTLFGFIQQKTGIWIMPYYLALFALLNFIFLELAYRRIATHKANS